MSVNAVVYSKKTVETVALQSNTPTERITYYLKGNEHIHFLQFRNTLATVFKNKAYSVKVGTEFSSSRPYKRGSEWLVNIAAKTNYTITLAEKS